MTPVEILRAGIVRLKTVGWKQGGGIGAGGECCAVLTLDDVSRECARAIQAVKDTLGRTAPLATWNDEPGRTVEEVIAAFEKTIVRLESGQ